MDIQGKILKLHMKKKKTYKKRERKEKTCWQAIPNCEALQEAKDEDRRISHSWSLSRKARPNIQQRLESFDNYAHVGPEISFILYA